MRTSSSKKENLASMGSLLVTLRASALRTWVRWPSWRTPFFGTVTPSVRLTTRGLASAPSSLLRMLTSSGSSSGRIMSPSTASSRLLASRVTMRVQRNHIILQGILSSRTSLTSAILSLFGLLGGVGFFSLLSSLSVSRTICVSGTTEAFVLAAI